MAHYGQIWHHPQNRKYITKEDRVTTTINIQYRKCVWSLDCGFEICERTDIHTRSSQYFAPLTGDGEVEAKTLKHKRRDIGLNLKKNLKKFLVFTLRWHNHLVTKVTRQTSIHSITAGYSKNAHTDKEHLYRYQLSLISLFARKLFGGVTTHATMISVTRPFYS